LKHVRRLEAGTTAHEISFLHIEDLQFASSVLDLDLDPDSLRMFLRDAPGLDIWGHQKPDSKKQAMIFTYGYGDPMEQWPDN